MKLKTSLIRKLFAGVRGKTWPAYAVPAAISISTKIVLYLCWLESPFRYFCSIDGLDMKTHMGYARRFIEGSIEFSAYRLMTGISYLIFGESHFVEVVVAIQMLSGVLVSILIVFILLHLSRDRLASMLAGTFYAVYSTSAIYECFILPESIFAFLCCAAMAVPFFLSSRRGRPVPLFVSGALCILPLLAKFAGALISFSMLGFSLFIALSRRGAVPSHHWRKRRCILLFSGAASVLLSASVWNIASGQHAIPLPSMPDFSYVFSLGATENISSLSLPSQAKPGVEKSEEGGKIYRRLANYGEKFLMIFHHYEVPNNINCYFVRNCLPPLPWMLKSTLLMPLAVIGILILVAGQKATTRYSILFIVLVSLAIPMVAFFPLARYRLSLVPLFCIFAAYPLVFLRAKFAGAGYFTAPAIYLALLMGLAYFTSCGKPGADGESLFCLRGGGDESHLYRSQDFVSFGIGMERAGSFDQKYVEMTYRTAFHLAPESGSAAVHLSNFLMKKGDFAEAEMILSLFHRRNPGNRVMAVNYSASLLGLGKPAEALSVLREIGEPQDPVGRTRYFYQMGEAYRLQGLNEQAVEAFDKAMSSAQTKEEAEIILAALRNLADKNPR